MKRVFGEYVSARRVCKEGLQGGSARRFANMAKEMMLKASISNGFMAALA